MQDAGGPWEAWDGATGIDDARAPDDAMPTAPDDAMPSDAGAASADAPEPPG